MKYKIRATMYTYLEAEVEAEDEQHAWELGNDLDGDMFSEVPFTGGWDITDVVKMEDK